MDQKNNVEEANIALNQDLVEQGEPYKMNSGQSSSEAQRANININQDFYRDGRDRNSNFKVYAIPAIDLTDDK